LLAGLARSGFTRKLQTMACLACALEETKLTAQKGLVSAHERERHQHTGVAAVGSAGGVFSLVRLPWAHNLTDFSPRRGGLEALRAKWNAG